MPGFPRSRGKRPKGKAGAKQTQGMPVPLTLDSASRRINVKPLNRAVECFSTFLKKTPHQLLRYSRKHPLPHPSNHASDLHFAHRFH